MKGMTNPRIPPSEFQDRIRRMQDKMTSRSLDALIVYGDEYRKENLRYASNYWPIFERGAILFGMEGEPVVLCAPEGEQVAREMSAFPDIRLLPDFLCVTVPDEIEYPLASYTSFKKLATELRGAGRLDRLGVVGIDAMSAGLYRAVEEAFACELVDANDILFELRITKSANEIACLREAARIADQGIKAIMEADIIGMSEVAACGIAEAGGRREGAE